MRRFRQHIGNDLLVRIGIALVVMIAVLTAATYLYVYNSTRTATLRELEQETAQRVRDESTLFELAEDNLERFSEQFLRLYRSDVEVSEEEFWEMFSRDEDGAVRLHRRYFDGVFSDEGRYTYGMSGFVGNNQSVDDPDFRRRLVLSYRVASRLGPAFQTRFENTHVSFPENGIILFWPEEPWGLMAEPDLPMNELGTIAATLEENNPEREPVWTGLYFDETAQNWTITYEVPLDYEGRHLINPSHDVPLTELIERMVTDQPDGSYNFIIKHNGDLVAHPEPRPEEQKWIGQIEREDIENPVVLHAYERISEEFPNPQDAEPEELVEVIDNPEDDTYLAVASFPGPDWWYVTVYPQSLIREQAHESALVIMVEGLLMLLVVIVIVTVVVRRRVGRPLLQLREAAQALGDGRYDDVAEQRVAVPTHLPNEVGLFASRFVEMAGNIRDSDRDLERIIEERTSELKAANESLRELGLMDSLTGIHNRRSFDRDLTRLVRAVEESGGTFSLVMIDIDFFKQYNDTLGHAEGDRVLEAIGQSLRDMTRNEDRAYRYGGEEFAILCTNTQHEQAIAVAERIVENVRSLNISHPESPHGVVTVSAGVAELDAASPSGESVVKAADEKLYQAKAAGRNRLQG